MHEGIEMRLAGKVPKIKIGAKSDFLNMDQNDLISSLSSSTRMSITQQLWTFMIQNLVSHL